MAVNSKDCLWSPAFNSYISYKHASLNYVTLTRNRWEIYYNSEGRPKDYKSHRVMPLLPMKDLETKNGHICCFFS